MKNIVSLIDKMRNYSFVENDNGKFYRRIPESLYHRLEKLILQTYRKELVKTDPTCCWCGRTVKEYNGLKKSVPDDQATIEHLSNIKLRKAYNKIGEIMLACYRCNSSRGRKKVKSLEVI